MQHIGVNYEDERGKIIETLPINFADVMNILYDKYSFDEVKIKYPWISTIDPYGDTTFNNLQWPFLVNEFTFLRKEIANDIAG